MKSLSYLFVTALLLSTSPLMAMDPPVMDDAARQPLPKLTGKVFVEFFVFRDNPFEYDEENGNADYMTGRHDLKGKMRFDDSNLNQFSVATQGVDFRNYIFALKYCDNDISCELEHIPGRPKKAENEKFNLAKLPKLLFRAVENPKAVASVNQVIDLKWLDSNITTLRLRKGIYDPEVLHRFTNLTSLDAMLAKNCPDLSHCTNLTSLDLGAHVDTIETLHFPKLINLCILSSSTIPDFSGVPNLKVLDVSYNRAFLNKEVLEDLRNKFPNIQLIQDD